MRPFFKNSSLTHMGAEQVQMSEWPTTDGEVDGEFTSSELTCHSMTNTYLSLSLFFQITFPHYRPTVWISVFKVLYLYVHVCILHPVRGKVLKTLLLLCLLSHFQWMGFSFKKPEDMDTLYWHFTVKNEFRVSDRKIMCSLHFSRKCS